MPDPKNVLADLRQKKEQKSIKDSPKTNPELLIAQTKLEYASEIIGDVFSLLEYNLVSHECAAVTCKFNMKDNLTPVSCTREECHIKLGSDGRCLYYTEK